MEDQKENVEQKEEVVEQPVDQEVEQEQPEAKEEQDRPEENYRAELARKNAEIARLKAAQEITERTTVKKYNPDDITTWNDSELKALKNSKGPQYTRFAEQAEDLLLERKFQRMREVERVQEKKMTVERELKTKYPESSDPSSLFSAKMEQVMYEYDLHKSPAGRLAAAKIVAAELGIKKVVNKDLERNREASRIRDVKGQMTDGDRSKPVDVKGTDKKIKDAVSKLNQKDLKASAEGIGDLLKLKGIDRSTFWKK